MEFVEVFVSVLQCLFHSIPSLINFQEVIVPIYLQVSNSFHRGSYEYDARGLKRNTGTSFGSLVLARSVSKISLWQVAKQGHSSVHIYTATSEHRECEKWYSYVYSVVLKFCLHWLLMEQVLAPLLVAAPWVNQLQVQLYTVLHAFVVRPFSVA